MPNPRRKYDREFKIEAVRLVTRFATDCLTELGEYESAMAEYEDAAENADCLSDSIQAVLDYLAVYELANGPEVNSAGDFRARMGEAMGRISGSDGKTGFQTCPTQFEISSAYPNPFNSTVRIAYSLPDAGEVTVSIHDVSGREVARLVDGVPGVSSGITGVPAGTYSVTWNAGGASAGVYFCKVASGSKVETTKLLLVK